MRKSVAIFLIVSVAVIAALADNPHVTRLVELLDVAISTAANGDVLTFDAASLKWINKQPVTSQGPQGIQGIPGIQGPQGIQGPEGATGSQGNPVVARFQVVDSATDLPQTVFFTPPDSEMYRINVYQETQPKPAGSITPCPHIIYSWTDDYSSAPPVGISPDTPIGCGGGSRGGDLGGHGTGYSLIVHNPGPLSVSISNPTGYIFSLYITIEKL